MPVNEQFPFSLQKDLFIRNLFCGWKYKIKLILGFLNPTLITDDFATDHLKGIEQENGENQISNKW